MKDDLTHIYEVLVYYKYIWYAFAICVVFYCIIVMAYSIANIYKKQKQHALSAQRERQLADCKTEEERQVILDQMYWSDWQGSEHT